MYYQILVYYIESISSNKYSYLYNLKKKKINKNHGLSTD